MHRELRSAVLGLSPAAHYTIDQWERTAHAAPTGGNNTHRRSSLFAPLLDLLQRPHRLHSFRSDNSLGEAPSRGLLDAAQSGPEVRQRDGHTGSERPRTGELALGAETPLDI